MLQYASFHAIPWDGDMALKSLQFMNLCTKQNFTIALANFTYYTNERLVQVRLEDLNELFNKE